jgi:hypothetical protein
MNNKIICGIAGILAVALIAGAVVSVRAKNSSEEQNGGTMSEVNDQNSDETSGKFNSVQGKIKMSSVYTRLSDSRKYLLLVTAFDLEEASKKGADVIGYVIDNESVKSNTYYERFTVGAVSFSPESIFGENYADYKLIIQEIELPAEDKTYSVCAFIGKTDGEETEFLSVSNTATYTYTYAESDTGISEMTVYYGDSLQDIGTIEYEKDMTWAEYVTSSYNTAKFYLNEEVCNGALLQCINVKINGTEYEAWKGRERITATLAMTESVDEYDGKKGLFLVEKTEETAKNATASAFRLSYPATNEELEGVRESIEENDYYTFLSYRPMTKSYDEWYAIYTEYGGEIQTTQDHDECDSVVVLRSLRYSKPYLLTLNTGRADGKDYTWSEWVKSAYNTAGAYIANGYVHLPKDENCAGISYGLNSLNENGIQTSVVPTDKVREHFLVFACVDYGS